MANVNSWWSSLSPTAKRNLAVGSIGTVLIATIIGLASVSPEVDKPSSKQATIQHILTDSDPRSFMVVITAMTKSWFSLNFANLLMKLSRCTNRLVNFCPPANIGQRLRKQNAAEIPAPNG